MKNDRDKNKDKLNNENIKELAGLFDLLSRFDFEDRKKDIVDIIGN